MRAKPRDPDLTATFERAGGAAPCGTVCAMDGADKPTWTYSRRVPHGAAPPAHPRRRNRSYAASRTWRAPASSVAPIDRVAGEAAQGRNGLVAGQAVERPFGGVGIFGRALSAVLQAPAGADGGEHLVHRIRVAGFDDCPQPLAHRFVRMGRS